MWAWGNFPLATKSQKKSFFNRLLTYGFFIFLLYPVLLRLTLSLIHDVISGKFDNIANTLFVIFGVVSLINYKKTGEIINNTFDQKNKGILNKEDIEPKCRTIIISKEFINKINHLAFSCSVLSVLYFIVRFFYFKNITYTYLLHNDPFRKFVLIPALIFIKSRSFLHGNDKDFTIDIKIYMGRSVKKYILCIYTILIETLIRFIVLFFGLSEIFYILFIFF